MASLRKKIENRPENVWDAVRDFGAVHSRVAPGFLVDLRVEGKERIVTLANGQVAREQLVTRDDETCRLVYSVVEGRVSHYNAAVQVFREDEDKSRLAWTIDLLPNERAPAISGMMDQARGIMKKALDAA